MHGSIRRNLGRRLISTMILSLHVLQLFAPSPINCAEGHISAFLVSAISRLTAATSGMYGGRLRRDGTRPSQVLTAQREYLSRKPSARSYSLPYSWMRIPTCKLPCSRVFSVHNSISESAPIRLAAQPCEPAVGRHSIDTHRALV